MGYFFENFNVKIHYEKEDSDIRIFITEFREREGW